MTESEAPVPSPLDVARRMEARAASTSDAKEGMFSPEQQAEVDRIVRDRIQRVEAKYADLDVEAAQARLKETDERIREGERIVLRNSIAARVGLSPDDRDLFLTGTDAATLEAQARLLSERWGLGKPQGNVAPREGRAVSSPAPQDREMREFANNLFGNDVWW